MLLVSNFLLLAILVKISGGKTNARQKRFLLFDTSTQYGVFATISIPLEEDSTVSVAWFFEANYYTVANATYWAPLYDDVTIPSVRHARKAEDSGMFTRQALYISVENLLKRHGFSGRPCLLRVVCEVAHKHLFHNGLAGDLIHVLLTPSSSEEEGIDDEFYVAEYLGVMEECHYYEEDCPESPLDYFAIQVEQLLKI